MESFQRKRLYTTLKYSRKATMFFRILFIIGMAGLLGATTMTYYVFGGFASNIPGSDRLVECVTIQKSVMDAYGMEIWFLFNMVLKSSLLIIPIFKFPRTFSETGWFFSIVIANVCMMVFILGVFDLVNDAYQLSVLLANQSKAL